MTLNILKIAVIMLALAVSAACTKDPPATPEEPAANITMTTQASKVNLGLQMGLGTGSITIDWGDGEGSKKYVPSYTSSCAYLIVDHYYSNTSEHTITITGDSITEFGCAKNQLTALNLSQNPTLTHLYCSLNQLTTLDVSKNIALQELYCSHNPLTTLDVSICLFFQNPQITVTC
ncbi:MAG: hypothetical protein LBV26_05935 [Bacteroidales bacterium]|jgi:Leucine-rich repeat (LRR) protein|nr:hypothetical protein [Bacteroidales bacterium]